MGSATREATTALRDTLAQQGGAVDLAVGEELLQVARLLGSSAQLRSVLADPTADAAGKAALVERAFSGKVAPGTLAVLKAAAQQRWSRPADIIDGLEEAGVRALAQSAPDSVSITDELFAFGGAVTSDPQLELALRSKLAEPAAKAGVVERLLGGKVSPATLAIARQLVMEPRGRGIRESLRWAAQVAADQSDAVLATVTTARPLTTEQRDRLRGALQARYGRAIAINTVIDPTIIGGLRVQVGDDVIDSSIATRLNDVRLQLA
ncbi:F0F1 ATP synthase subunit delta [Gryllotalpicola ginsengisoli]|uniref:F0F1 ATP synthase subunit delta n=1 Tax=Gryllotalpicola ginsengisoli TaxID=444608 RepID=UPI0003B68DC6|nr:F0F1 ATP synthase subunit delta [Gryllotalpicola ginsengisoli]